MLIFMPMSPGWIVPMLAMAGVGLGIFVPADKMGRSGAFG
jgi:hypothetical protein